MSNTYSFLPQPRRHKEVERVLQSLNRGGAQVSKLESQAVDIKEEAGRRGPDGTILPGSRQNEEAAKGLAEAAACMANTQGGGTLIVGVDDKTGQIIGAATDPHWLRSRIYDLTGRKLAVNIQTVMMNGKRLMIIDAPQALEPVRYGGRYQHRVDARCVPVTTTQLLGGLFADLAMDPSNQPTNTPIGSISKTAELALRTQLLNYDPGKAQLALPDLLSRLGLVTGDREHLNMAGHMLLCPQERPSIDYSHRNVPGGPSTVRIATEGRSLLEEVLAVETAANLRNPPSEITVGLQVHKVWAVPRNTLRESLLNAVCHRDWSLPHPTVVEHIGNHFRVTSPGGLIGGVTENNIITHSSVPRYRTLMTAIRKIGLVEQEGVGVDKMFAEMIRIGSRPPSIESLPDPAVRIDLYGRQADEKWHRFFVSLSPPVALDDVDAALLVWWGTKKSLYLTSRSCADLLQRSESDAEESLQRVAAYHLQSRSASTVGGPDAAQTYSSQKAPLLVPIKVPLNTPPAWRLSRQALHALGLSQSREWAESALAWAGERGRISSNEYREMTGVSMATAAKRLKALADQGVLAPSSASGRGRGLHYLPT